ncbi:hypothetical protein JXB37_01435 [candidate division WOR-3 bacterium]|nr:hypothetical protein [candidate division WOR-3 bacterium]
MNRMVAPMLAAGLMAGCGWQLPYPQQAAQPAPAPQVVVVREAAATEVRHVYHEVPVPVEVSQTVNVQSESERDRVVVVRDRRHPRYRPRHPVFVPTVRIVYPPRHRPRGRHHGPGCYPPPPRHRPRGGPPPNNRQREQPPPNIRPPRPDPPGQRGVRVRDNPVNEAARPARTGRG